MEMLHDVIAFEDAVLQAVHPHQIQDIINIKTMYAVNFVCKDGVILNKICCTTNGVMKPTHYVFGAFGTYTMNIPIYILHLKNGYLKAKITWAALRDAALQARPTRRPPMAPIAFGLLVRA
jgi:hypothetical protein